MDHREYFNQQQFAASESDITMQAKHEASEGIRQVRKLLQPSNKSGGENA